MVLKSPTFYCWLNSCFHTSSGQISNSSFLSSWLYLPGTIILKCKDITLPKMVCIDKAMAFPVVMHGCESWTVKKAECQRIDALEL